MSLHHHLTMLHRLGLYAIPAWGGGKLLPGTNQRALALEPPQLPEILSADYSGGLIVLCGTENPFGGYLVGIDIDNGPMSWTAMPKGFLYAELGTKNNKIHIFARTTDRLEGTLNIYGADPKSPVAEIKGLNLSLRSWPSQPPDKPRGYQPLAWAIDPAADPPALTARQLAEGIADLITLRVGIYARVRSASWSNPNGHVSRPTGDLALRIESVLAGRNADLGLPSSEGWQSGWCPFHEDRKRKSFRVNFEGNGWVCYAGCGKGYLWSLARRLGILTTPDRSDRKRDEHKPVAVEWSVKF